MIASYIQYQLQFKRPAGTSRGVYKTRPVWYLFLKDAHSTGIGECAPLPGLSKETPEEVETILNEICKAPQHYQRHPELLTELPSVRFAFETALLDMQTGGKQLLFSSEFTRGEQGIPINGLIWMGELPFMQEQIQEKLQAGFRCIKLKIGALNFNQELELIKAIQEQHEPLSLTLRVDANGAFPFNEALDYLEQLAEQKLHSIEQPIAAGQWDRMAELCRKTPVPIALDEELIGINQIEQKKELLETIRPQFIILKPSLHGGFSGCDEWIELAEQANIGWWITSYLESNVGLNAIAQWTFSKKVSTHQGLGTGQLFTNNIDSPLFISGEKLFFNPNKVVAKPSEAGSFSINQNSQTK